jgi:hypothetical protein
MSGVVGLVVLAILGMPVHGNVAEAQQEEPEAGGSAGSGLELVDQTTWLRPGERFEADVRVDGPAAGAALQVIVYQRLVTRSEFQQSLEGIPGPRLSTGIPQPLAELPTNPDGSVTAVTLDAAAGGVSLESEGVYPVELRLLDEAGATSASLVTHLVVLPQEGMFPALATSMVADISSPPALQPDGRLTMSRATLDRIDERVEVLQQEPDVPLTLAPRPETLDGLAGIDDDRGDQLLDELRAARRSRPVMARPYTDIDTAAFIEADLLPELNVQAGEGANVVRSRLGTEPVPGIWFPRGTVGEPAAQLRFELGARRAVVDQDAVREVPGRDPSRIAVAPIQLGEGGPTTMVKDEALASRLTRGNGLLDAQHFVAELAMIWAELPAIERGVVVHLPPDAPLDADVVARALRLVQESPILAPVTLDGLFDRFAARLADGGEALPVAVPAPHEIDGDLSALTGRLRRARERVGGFGVTVGDEQAGESLEDALLLATGHDTPQDERTTYVDRVNSELAQLTGVVTAPEEFRITLTSRSSTIPLNLTNHTDQPIEVRIDFDSEQLQFPEGESLPVTLEPGPNRLDIRVRTLASGAFPLDIQILSPDGSIVLDQTTFDIRSTVVSGVGLVLSIGAGLFLAIWWLRHWRRARRAGRLLPATASIGEPADTVSDGAEGAEEVVDDETGRRSRGLPRRRRYQPAHLAGRRPR